MLIPRFSFLQYRLTSQAQAHTQPNIELIMKITFYQQLNQALITQTGTPQVPKPHSLAQPIDQAKTLAPYDMPSLQSFLLKFPDALSRNERQAISRFLRKQSLVDSLCQPSKALKFKTTDLIVSS